MKSSLVFVVVESNLDHYFDQFIEIKDTLRRPRTVKWYKDAYRYYKAATAGLGPAWPPTPAHALAFFKMFKTKKLKPNTRSNYYRGVNGFFNWLVKGNLLERNPLDDLGGVKVIRALPKSPDEEEVAELLTVVSQAIRQDQGRKRWQVVRDLAMFSLALDTGLRLNELAAMCKRDLSVKFQQVVVFSWKDTESRTLALGDEATEDVARWLEQRAKLNPPKSLDAMWLSNYQGKGLRQLTDSGISQRLTYWLGKADTSRFSLNNLRHAFAVFSLRNGADLIDIKDQMGHASIKTTAIYTEVVNKGRGERHRKTSPRKNLPFDS